jgi:hypothetical protein
VKYTTAIMGTPSLIVSLWEYNLKHLVSHNTDRQRENIY